MLTLEQRIARIEKMLSQVLHKGVEKIPARMSEAEVIIKYQVSRDRLRQMRNGYKGIPPVLFKWGSIGGRRIDYDVKELDNYFKRTINFLSRSSG